ncbi:hypothetical protein SXCC_04301 [Gluconacetobacter sp. SXCC-1]|nr:hypothetical protein SXCC_04301 [Gluconacetobacter sp. SXCC-1]
MRRVVSSRPRGPETVMRCYPPDNPCRTPLRRYDVLVCGCSRK